MSIFQQRRSIGFALAVVDGVVDDDDAGVGAAWQQMRLG